MRINIYTLRCKLKMVDTIRQKGIDKKTMRNIHKIVEINELLRIYGALLTRRQAEVLQRRYGQDWSLGEIAEADGISRQGVLNFENKAVRLLRNYEKKLGVYARESKIKALFERTFIDEHARLALQEVFT